MQYYRIFSSIADLYSPCGGLETQLLFGESVLSGGSGRFYAYSQIVRDQYFWRPYPGTLALEQLVPCVVHSDCTPNAAVISFSALLEPWKLPLPFGTLLSLSPNNQLSLPSEMVKYLSQTFGPGIPTCNPRDIRHLKENISSSCLLEDAERCLDFPYLWGGRSLHKGLHNFGIDCSGFVNLLYQSQGWNIPRNARDQYLDCIFVDSFEELPIGGLVFLHEKETSKISHVMLKKDSHGLIHASESIGKVHISILGRDCELSKGNFYTGVSTEEKKIASFGIPKKRKAFL
ncbi:C40 family peptidase [Chlamydia pecorum]|uniref:C40 family peptidase n=1 Tax=Chlamydia pecorum TaxID=85991 RepID=UPI0002EBE394|nr:NlpC/P60 family protein [Chlamydia pecorum]AGW38933.1 polysaccharide hydrolase-invasin repeat family [Chlamydia pecorum W73]ETF37585.1 polysaccharide hydrolase-invasin repeat family protein [Chlamydia pecorum VR629]ETF40332.1 polysaccharide hydrolase-invasin repeat family protein [Chlamydia pecorum IPTaLE]UFP06470.1 NlpC/P60 family protein [Chlamydia pecorum]UJT77185.1 polysaccharide hydrolase-invasin repeat family protein [Chlamydia pecorum]